MKNTQIKVLMIGPARTVKGGVSAVVNDYYRAGLDKQVELTYLGTMEDGSKWHKLWVAAKALFQFIGLVRKNDLIHVNMASDSSIYRKLPFIWIARLNHRKILIHQHGGNIRQFYFEQCGPGRQKMIRKTLEQADRILVIAPYLWEIFARITGEERLVLFPNAILLPEKYNKDYTGQKILFLGRMCKEKGIEELLIACGSLKTEFPDLRLYLGGVWEDTHLKARADEMGTWIVQPGWIDTEKKEELLKECNLFVLPSYFEGHPISLLEGMAFGCACIGTEIGGITQMLIHEENGLLVPVKDSEALKAALRRCLENAELQKGLGQAALKKIAQEYSLEKNIKKLTDIYRDML
ncbi:MAG: glycosyltransferase family 4 protein [Lachnospiraceae bacterium]